MFSAVVEYFDVDNGVMLGSESYLNLLTVLIPRITGKGTFCYRSFAGHASRHWHVVSITSPDNGPGEPVLVRVELRLHAIDATEYLNQTVARITGNTFSLIHPGTLVEIDYGFVQDAISKDFGIHSSERFIDSHLLGEMHKRRLAVVTKVSKSTLQVVPITSRPGSQTDPTRVEISASTLSKLSFYGSSGKNSWALCDMIESVSIQRVLPPSLALFKGGQWSPARNPTYPSVVGRAELRQIQEAVVHGVGMGELVTAKDRLREANIALKAANANLSKVETERADVSSDMAKLRNELSRLRCVEQVAMRWEKGAKRDGESLDEEVAFLLELEADESLGVKG